MVARHLGRQRCGDLNSNRFIILQLCLEFFNLFSQGNHNGREAFLLRLEQVKYGRHRALLRYMEALLQLAIRERLRYTPLAFLQLLSQLFHFLLRRLLQSVVGIVTYKFLRWHCQVRQAKELQVASSSISKFGCVIDVGPLIYVSIVLTSTVW